MKLLTLNDSGLPVLLILMVAATMIFSLFLMQVLLIILLLVYLYYCFDTKQILFAKSPLDIFIIIFIATRVLSIFMSTDFNLSVQYFYKEIIFYSFYFIFHFYLSKKEKDYQILLLKILIIAAVLSSLYGTTKVLLGIVERAESSTSGYFTLGTFLTTIYAIVIASGKNQKVFANRYLWIISLIVILVGILFTYNRTHWGIVAAITLFVGITRERILLLVVLVSAVISIVLIPSLTERFMQLIHFSQNYSDRDVIWSGARILLFQRPVFGFGIGTFREIFPLFNQLQDKGVGSWHSDYFQMYFESGVLGLTAFLMLMYRIFFVTIKALRSKYSTILEKDIMFSVLLGVATLYLTAFLSGFILSPINSIQFFLLISLLSANSFNERIMSNPESQIIKP